MENSVQWHFERLLQSDPQHIAHWYRLGYYGCAGPNEREAFDALLALAED